MPDVTALGNHLKKQGFHVVFSSASAGGDVEVGFCNVRKEPPAGAKAEPVFMARFVASGTNFNAVMKSDDTACVPGYVKKFALAKVLKIDTSGAGGGGKKEVAVERCPMSLVVVCLCVVCVARFFLFHVPYMSVHFVVLLINISVLSHASTAHACHEDPTQIATSTSTYTATTT
jgi:hypothetical protein